MTATVNPPPSSASQKHARPRRRLVIAAAVAVLAAGGLGAGLALSLGGPSTSTVASSAYSYYRSMMGGYGRGSMMGGSYDWMGSSGYQWMTGGVHAPGWMTGGNLPGFMMGSGNDPGRAMGQFWANAPGPRVSSAEATRLGDETPAGATVDRGARRISFVGNDPHLVVLASPSMPAERFRIAGMTNPTVVVPLGATVTVEVVNADSDMAHGLVVTADSAASSAMPMMVGPPVFSGAARWFLGESTSAGMHDGSLTFTASRLGTYQYLCPIPGHAQEGMAGTFVVGPR